MTQSKTHNKPTCMFAQLQNYLYELLIVVYRILVDITILGGEIVEEHLH